MSDERPELKPDETRGLTRRRILKAGVRGACLLGLGGAVAALVTGATPTVASKPHGAGTLTLSVAFAGCAANTVVVSAQRPSIIRAGGGTSTMPWTFEGRLKTLWNKTLRWPGHFQSLS